MSENIQFGCLPTMIGSLPHTNPDDACSAVLRQLRALPAWPQLPGRSVKENMYAQFSEGFPGVVVDDSRIYIDRSRDIDGELEKLYAAYADNDASAYGFSRDYAAGFHALIASRADKAVAIKGQVTGPISWGLAVADGAQWAIYDDTLAEAIARHLRLKAAWQYQELSRVSRNVIIFVDEPYLTSLGSAFVALPTEQVKELLEETLGGISGLRGLHCCGNTDWSLLLGLPINILSFDAYSYASALSAYAADVRSFVAKGGAIAWGIVPNDEDHLAKETVASLKDRLEEAIAPFANEGVTFRRFVEQGLITPACGLASLSAEAAEQALAQLGELSGVVRKRYLETP
ncbi:MAG: methionine synthase [Dehalococcoidia bacterium]|nr:methionine synthase [Dehalococcoidia bacterium]